MTRYILRRGFISQRLKSGLAAPYVEDFTGWLRSRGYSEKTIRELTRLLANWTYWASKAGYALGTIRSGHTASVAAIKKRKRARWLGDINQASVGTAALFMRYLEDRGVLPPLRVPSVTEEWPILGAFAVWMREHRGLAETTQAYYRSNIVRFLEALGDDPAAYKAEAVRAFVFERARAVSVARTKGIAVAIRAFLRYLIATGQCPPGRDHAIPRLANWKLASIPKFLSDEETKRIIAACGDERRLRDKAIILLLVRLGLRASEVAGLTFSDIDWQHGRIRLSGKARREEHLPLTQEVGDTILAYIKRGRPTLPTDRLFITELAPLRPISRITIKCLVRSALERAGIESACKGAHILRHTAATTMLRHGVSLAGVGAVLRHRSPTMAAYYAKVDFDVLREIAQPWPGRLSC